MSAKNFEDNFKYLEGLSEELQGGEVSVDELVPKMKKASEAMKVCKEVLKATKSKLTEIEKDFEELMGDDGSDE